MRESLKNLFTNKIMLENNSYYYYSVKPFELKNMLGNVVATLEQYSFSNTDTNNPASYTLYKTKEGNWYDVEESGLVHEKSIVRMLKSAIDKKENEQITG